MNQSKVKFFHSKNIIKIKVTINKLIIIKKFKFKKIIILIKKISKSKIRNKIKYINLYIEKKNREYVIFIYPHSYIELNEKFMFILFLLK